jgi:hypothetical protein
MNTGEITDHSGEPGLANNLRSTAPPNDYAITTAGQWREYIVNRPAVKFYISGRRIFASLALVYAFRYIALA